MTLTREEMRRRWLDKSNGKAPALDPVEEVEAKLAELPNAIRARASKEQDRRTEATDSRYWVAVCFQTREEKEEFLAKAGLADMGEDIYLDGRETAERLGIELTSERPKWRDAAPKKRLVDLT